MAMPKQYQAVLGSTKTHTGSNLHWSQYIKLQVYWGILYL